MSELSNQPVVNAEAAAPLWRRWGLSRAAALVAVTAVSSGNLSLAASADSLPIASGLTSAGGAEACQVLDAMKGPDTSCAAPTELPTACEQRGAAALHDIQYVPAVRAAGSEIARAANYEPDQATLATHNIDEGIQDDAGVVANKENHAEGILAAGKLIGADILRMMVYSDSFPYHGRSTKLDSRPQLDAAVARAEACGYEPQMNLTYNQSGNTLQRTLGFIKAAAKRYKSVHRFELFNEPNSKWLHPFKGKTAAQTYWLIVHYGTKVIEDINPRNEVIAFNVSSNYWPLKFINDVANACPAWYKKLHGKCQLTFDELGYHPYEWFKKMPKSFNHNKKLNSKFIGITAMPTVKRGLDRLWQSGKIMTPNRQEPGVAWDEFALMTDAKGPYAKRNIPEALRAAIYLRVKKLAPRLGYIEQAIFYQFDWAKREDWQSGMVTPNGTLSSTYFALMKDNQLQTLGQAETVLGGQ